MRTANAFLAHEVVIVGRRRWNRRGAMVTDRYQHIRHVDSAAVVECSPAWASAWTWAAVRAKPVSSTPTAAAKTTP